MRNNRFLRGIWKKNWEEIYMVSRKLGNHSGFAPVGICTMSNTSVKADLWKAISYKIPANQES